MSMRKPVSSVKDKKIFSNTADKTKKVNVKPTIMRGGTRL